MEKLKKEEQSWRGAPGSGASGKGSMFHVRTDDVIPNPYQPRKFFDGDKLKDLESSVRAHGIIQPLVVVKKGEKYQLIIGERRWKAAKCAGLSEVPVIIKDIGENKGLEIALVENLQREDLNAIEEARAYCALLEEHDYTQEQLSSQLGKSRSSIANALRLLKLPDPIQEDIAKGVLSPGHGRALLSLENDELIQSVSLKIKTRGLSVRNTEELVRVLKDESKKMAREESSVATDMEKKLRNVLGVKVTIREKSAGTGKIEIHFSTRQDFERLTESIIMNIPSIKKFDMPMESSLL